MATREWKCDLCKKRFNGECSYEKHMQSNKHKKRSEQTYAANTDINCKFCVKCFSGVESYVDHIKSDDHLRIVGNSEIKEKASLLQLFKDKPDLLKCPDCDVPFTCWISADDHFRSDRHIKKVSDDEKIKVLSRLRPKSPSSKANNCCQRRCHLCNVLLPGEAAVKSHNEGKKHKKRMEMTQENVSLSDATNSSTDSIDNYAESISKTELKKECEICKVPLLGKEAIEKHYVGIKHKRKLAEIGNKSNDSAKPHLFSQTSTAFAAKPINCEELIAQIRKEDMEKQLISDNTESCSSNSGQSMKLKGEVQTTVSVSDANSFVSLGDINISTSIVDISSWSVDDTNNSLPVSDISSSENSLKTELIKECDICKVPLSGKEAIEKHYAGAKHKRKLTEIGNKCNDLAKVCSLLKTTVSLAEKPMNCEEHVAERNKIDTEKQTISDKTESCSNNSGRSMGGSIFSLEHSGVKERKAKKTYIDEHLEENYTWKNITSSTPRVQKPVNFKKAEKCDNRSLLDTCSNHRFKEYYEIFDNGFKINLQKHELGKYEPQICSTNINTSRVERSDQTLGMIDTELNSLSSADLRALPLSNSILEPMLPEKPVATNNNGNINQLKVNENVLDLNHKSEANEYLTNKLLDTEKHIGKRRTESQERHNMIELCNRIVHSTSGKSTNGTSDWQKGCSHCGILCFRDKSAYRHHIKTETHIANVKAGKNL